ncbi:MAG TPA: PKD domain-containing protein, partial [Gemmataceae bacterium]|nr:PKD domain-containing protein [Gemmataceae bacterium]
EVGARPTFSALDIDGPATAAVALRVTNAAGQSDTATALITIENVPPSVTIAGPTDGVPGQPRTFTFSATDVFPADRAAGFTYAIDWNGDGITDQTVPGLALITLEHTFTATGTYSVQVTATDKDGGISDPATHLITIATAELQTDPTNSGLTALFVGGTVNDDVILLTRQGPSTVLVQVNGVDQGAFLPTGRIIVYGLDGNDAITVGNNLSLPALLFGGSGNDILTAGGGLSVLLGEDGNDTLQAGHARTILIGGAGADTLVGGGEEDLLIAATTIFDHNVAALNAVMTEWGRVDATYTTRVLHLTGGASGGLNGSTLLTSATVFDDGTVDVLTGNDSRDWFFANLSGGVLDSITDLKNPEAVFEL